MTDWDEVKRLAADFQKVQLSSSTQKLSERNCIEVVTLLMEKKMLDLIFSSDGKEYITPQHLVTEILGELYVAGGRVNLVELAKTIGVDLGHINAHIGEVIKGHKDIISVLGQLIDSTYITRIAGEINEKLVQFGQINVGDLTMQYDLPAEFIQTHIVEKNLGKLIFGQQDRNDPRVVFTESFIARSRAKIRGALVGLTKPVPITAILAHVDVTEKLFFTLFDQSSMYGSLTSRQPGAQYIPNVYARSQHEWVHNFYKQNGYLEYDALTRQGISDYKTYLKKSSLDLQYLSSCAISKSLLERIEADIEECVASKSHLDLHSNLPSVFNDADIKNVMEKILTPQKQKETVILEGYLLSKSFIDTLAKDIDELLKEKAKSAVESGRYQQYQTELQVASQRGRDDMDEPIKVDKREERRKKAAGGKAGGGTQGRETKTKSTKNKKRDKAVEDVEEVEVPKTTLEIISQEDIGQSIQIVLESEGLDDLMNAITEYLHPVINEKGLQLAADIYLTTVQDRTASRRQTHNDVQNKLNTLAGDIRLFEKGIKLLPSDVQALLYKYLLKSQCTDFVNEILNYISSEEGGNTNVDGYNNDQRIKFINELKAEYRAPLIALVKTLSGANIDEFMESIDAALATCSMIMKKVDKKKDRVLVLNHKHALLEEIEKCEDPPVVLHLATLIVFIAATQCMLHASGRHIVNLLSFLKQYMTPEQYEEFSAYHDMVGMVLGGGSDVETAKERLREKMPAIKKIAADFKKSAGEKS